MEEELAWRGGTATGNGARGGTREIKTKRRPLRKMTTTRLKNGKKEGTKGIFLCSGQTGGGGPCVGGANSPSTPKWKTKKKKGPVVERKTQLQSRKKVPTTKEGKACLAELEKRLP